MLKWLKRIVLTILLVFFLAVGVFFAIRNPQLIRLDLIFWQGPELSVALYTLLSFSVGACSALLVNSVTYFCSARQVRVLNKRLATIQHEIDSFRKAAITQERLVDKE